MLSIIIQQNLNYDASKIQRKIQRKQVKFVLHIVVGNINIFKVCFESRKFKFNSKTETLKKIKNLHFPRQFTVLLYTFSERQCF